MQYNWSHVVTDRVLTLTAIKHTYINVSYCLFRRVCKIAKETSSTVICVRPYGTTRLLPDGFSRNLVFEDFFRKSVEKIKMSLKSDKNNRYFTERPIYVFDHISLIAS